MDVEIAYVARTGQPMAYRANDSSRDTIALAARTMPITDMRGVQTSLDSQGFELTPHTSAIRDFGMISDVQDQHRAEITALITGLTQADLVVVTGQGVRRFAERSQLSGQLDNSRPARFAHVDVSSRTALDFSHRSAPADRPSPRRSAHYNVWRATSGMPQDVPLALCDARSVSPDDLLPAQAIFDRDGVDLWSFEGLVLAHSPRHRWHWFSDMTPDEVIVFKTHDSDPERACCVPHVAFDNPLAPPGTPPRASIEMRAIAYWF
ncbi:CmcJ/NvfI family oxidoreductase [Novosphingobium terrae]|uniref:CmcJ/NvfI family oxidoreductase n=1 Tax=Novosphingobium terrae TaxID=2726189 RepID=UPI0019801F03|nr:CmcJ/NvfI family oxidoreductase [Novosphingobium terrae]